MDGVAAGAQLGNVQVSTQTGTSTQIGLTGIGAEMFAGAYVMTTSGRGFNPLELAEMFVNKLLAVSVDLPPEELARANEYRERIIALAAIYMGYAQKSQNTTTFNELMNAGHPEAAEIVRSL